MERGKGLTRTFQKKRALSLRKRKKNPCPPKKKRPDLIKKKGGTRGRHLKTEIRVEKKKKMFS